MGSLEEEGDVIRVNPRLSLELPFRKVIWLDFLAVWWVRLATLPKGPGHLTGYFYERLHVGRSRRMTRGGDRDPDLSFTIVTMAP